MIRIRVERWHTQPWRKKSWSAPRLQRPITRRGCRPMPKPKGGLGRGLGSLIPQQPAAQEETAEQPRHEPNHAQAHAMAATPESGLAMLPVDSISPNPHQPRLIIKDGELDELAASI